MMRVRRQIAGMLLAGLLAGSASAEATDANVYDGVIQSLQKATVSTRVEGMVTEVMFEPGQRVSEGQPLLRLDDTDYRNRQETARADVLRAEVALASARREMERTQALAARGAVSGVTLLKAEAAYSLADAVLAQVRADLEKAENNLDRTVIRAPISGIISAPSVSLGAFVKPGNRTLATIQQLDPVRLAYKVPYVERLEALQLVGHPFPESLLETVALTVLVSGTWTHPHIAYPSHVSSNVEPDTGLMTVWAEVPNPEHLLRPGMAVRVAVTQRIAETD